MESVRSEHSRVSTWAAAPTFKLRFASPLLPGRSKVAPLRPPRLLTPPVAGKVTTRSPRVAGEEAALRCVRRLWTAAPRDTLTRPQLTSQQYGWHWHEARELESVRAWNDRRIRRPIMDSSWMRKWLRILHEQRCT